MSIQVVHPTDLEWKSSKRVKGWEFRRLSGIGGQPIGGPTALHCRSREPVSYPAWVSSHDVDYLVVAGDLTLNGQQLSKGDYAQVGRGEDHLLSSDRNGEIYCFVPGRYIVADEVMDLIRAGKIPEEAAETLGRRPWIDHLRRQATQEIETVLVEVIRDSPSAVIRTLCIGVARGFSSEGLVNAVQEALKSAPTLYDRTGAVLWLAARERMTPDEWRQHFQIMSADPDETLAMMRMFHGAANNNELTRSVKDRIDSGEFDYSRPFYDFTLRLLDQSY